MSELGNGFGGELAKAKDAALNYLGRAPATERRVRDKLREKGYAPETIDTVVEDLTRVGLLDDETYARDFAKRLAEKETAGARWIETKLVSRGVHYSLAARVAEEFAAEGSDAALEAARERGSRMGHVTDQEAFVRRLAGQLQRRGFDAGESFEAARRVFEERE